MLEKDPSFVEARFNLGTVLHELGRLDDAEECFESVLERHPDHPDVLLNLGRIEYQRARHADAQSLFERAAALQPELPEAWFNLGLTHVAAGRLTEALRCHERASELRPTYRNALLGCAQVFELLGRRDRALAMYERILALQPDDVAVRNALAVALNALGRHAEAMEHLRRALELDPQFVDARYNLGFVHQGRNEYEAAIACYDEVLRINPSHGEAAWGRAISLLGMGDFARGWPAYEIRRTAPLISLGLTQPPHALPRWTGEPLAGKKIMLIGEQGAGDQIQFIRYASALAHEGAEVHLITDARLERLLATAPGVHRALRRMRYAGNRGFSYWSYLLSLPYRAGTTLESVPAQVPYLFAPQAAKMRWSRRLATLPEEQLKVGLAWQSGPAGHVWMQYRNMPLEALRPLIDVPDVSFVAVQFGSPDAGEFPGLDVGNEISDFADHAALLASLDLLITVDTVTAHLGGALGIPTWVMLPVCADWRWMRERRDSPWYPSVTLLRQTRLGDWSEVVERAAADLAALVAARTA